MQCFVKKDYVPTFENEKIPKLLYVCKAEENLTKLPCVMHMHEDCLEILYIKEGKGIHTIGGRQYHTQKGDILIFNSGVLHDERTNPEAGMSVYNCAATNIKFDGLRENCLIGDKEKPVLHSGKFSEDIENLFKMMHSQVVSDEKGSEGICHYLLLALIKIIRNQINKDVEPEQNDEDILGIRIKKYIDQHYSEELTLESISNAVNISISYMSHVFKKTTGYAPMQYVMYRRIGKAQSLLLGTQFSATEIAMMVGYDNSNYFNTIFTKTVGMSPIKYRKQWVDKDNVTTRNFNRELLRNYSL